MAEIQYLALLRGINVGGNSIIKMLDLKACFEDMDFTDILTYIQSGNVLFKSVEKDLTQLIDKIEKTVFLKFKCKTKVVVLTFQQLQKVVEKAPKTFGKDPQEYRYDVIFIKTPLTAKEAMKNISIKEGVDQAEAGKDVLYFSRLMSKASQSHLTKIISLPIYKDMTIRNWNTTTKLFVLMQKKNMHQN